jgi:hypothetical protein
VTRSPRRPLADAVVPSQLAREIRPLSDRCGRAARAGFTALGAAAVAAATRPAWSALGRAALAAARVAVRMAARTVATWAAAPWRASRRGTVYAVLAIVAAIAPLAPSFPQPLRAAVTVVFMLVVPGAAITAVLQVRDLLTEALLSVVLSAVIAVAGGQAMLALGRWSPRGFILVVAEASAPVLLARTLVIFARRQLRAVPVAGADGGR